MGYSATIALKYQTPSLNLTFAKSLAEANLIGSTVNRIVEEPQDSQFATASHMSSIIAWQSNSAIKKG